MLGSVAYDVSWPMHLFPGERQGPEGKMTLCPSHDAREHDGLDYYAQSDVYKLKPSINLSSASTLLLSSIKSVGVHLSRSQC